MRTSFARMERAASSNATVLIVGETGTGKSRAARAIHEASARASGPFVIVDCAAVPANLIESELFGHERGAFTGAFKTRIGAIEEASGGTLFLDEIGELSSELQPKLLSAIENRQIRRVGSNTVIPVDVRIITATHRDLRAAVNDERFRADLYFRLAVLTLSIPPLRERPEDIPLLVERLAANMHVTSEQSAYLRSHDFLVQLQRCTWPGNIRELRNHLERCLVFDDLTPQPSTRPDAQPADGERPSARSYADARRRALDAFERTYHADLLEAHEGKKSKAARSADMDRVYLHRLVRKHGLRE